jgi:hypothetical protein
MDLSENFNDPKKLMQISEVSAEGAEAAPDEGCDTSGLNFLLYRKRNKSNVLTSRTTLALLEQKCVRFNE